MSENFKKQTASLKKSVDRLYYRMNSIWRYLFMGMFQGIGAVIGATTFVLLVGIVLNFLGVFEPLHDQVEFIRNVLLEAVRKTPNL